MIGQPYSTQHLAAQVWAWAVEAKKQEERAERAEAELDRRELTADERERLLIACGLSDD